MKKELIEHNLTCPNGFNFQNLDELDENQVVKDLLEKKGIFCYSTSYWDYVMSETSDFDKAKGKWWFKKYRTHDFTDMEKACVESGIFEYCKNNKGLVCLYTTEENIAAGANFIKENYPELLSREIRYKFDEATINGGGSIYNINDFVQSRIEIK